MKLIGEILTAEDLEYMAHIMPKMGNAVLEMTEDQLDFLRGYVAGRKIINDGMLDTKIKIIAYELVDTPKPAATPKWISVNDKLPDAFKPVIVCRKYVKGALKIEQGYWDVNGWWMIYGARVKRVTHWMPFPEPPEED